METNIRLYIVYWLDNTNNLLDIEKYINEDLLITEYVFSTAKTREKYIKFKEIEISSLDFTESIIEFLDTYKTLALKLNLLSQKFAGEYHINIIPEIIDGNNYKMKLEYDFLTFIFSLEKINIIDIDLYINNVNNQSEFLEINCKSNTSLRMELKYILYDTENNDLDSYEESRTIYNNDRTHFLNIVEFFNSDNNINKITESLIFFCQHNLSMLDNLTNKYPGYYKIVISSDIYDNISPALCIRKDIINCMKNITNLQSIEIELKIY